MKEIKQGTLFGFEIVIKIPDDLEKGYITEKTLQEYVEQEKKYAYEEGIGRCNASKRFFNLF